MYKKVRHNGEYTVFARVIALFIVIAFMLPLAACNNATIGAEYSGYNQGADAETPPLPNQQNNAAQQPNAADRNFEPNDKQYYNESEQIDPIVELSQHTDEQANSAIEQSEEEATGQSNAADSQDSPTNRRPTEIDLTPIQREALVRLNPAPGHGVLAQTAGVSPVQVGIGADQAEDMPLLVMGADGTREAAQGMVSSTMRLIATSDISLLTDFESGARWIIEGRMFEKPHEAIVSQEFAVLNNLSIGDFVEFASFDLAVTDIIRMELVGIYSDTTREFPPQVMLPTPTFNRRNEIITTTDTLFYHPQFAIWLFVESIRIS